jgi:hypothetical protein
MPSPGGHRWWCCSALRRIQHCPPVTSWFEGGTSRLPDRLAAQCQLALDGYLVGLTIAPIIAVPDWRTHYAELLDGAAGLVPGARSWRWTRSPGRTSTAGSAR